MAMKLLVSLLILCALALTVSSIKFQNCGTYPVQVTGADVPGCAADASPCEIKKNTNVTVNIAFKTPTDGGVYTKMNNKVYGVIARISVPFPGYPASQVDMCDLGVTCPTKAGTAYTEKVMLPVASSDPALTLVAKWEFANADGTTIIGCFNVLLKIEN